MSNQSALLLPPAGVSLVVRVMGGMLTIFSIIGLIMLPFIHPFVEQIGDWALQRPGNSNGRHAGPGALPADPVPARA